jgi:hypothetical protein
MQITHAFTKAPAALSGNAAPTRRQPKRVSVSVRAEETFCRDQVNVPKSVSVEGTARIVFLGAEGYEAAVESRKDTYILDSGLEAGLELPFTCRGGICGACVGRVVQGEVDQSDVSLPSINLPFSFASL